MKLIMYLLAFLILPFTALAQEQEVHPIDAQYSKCLETDYSTVGMVECAAQAQAAWDKELNKYYQLLLPLLSPKQKEALRVAQRTWIAFRDQDLTFMVSLYGPMDGTIWRVVIAGERTERIRERALALKGYYLDLKGQ